MSARNSLDASRGGASSAVDDGSDSSNDSGSRPSSSDSDGSGGSSSSNSSNNGGGSVRDRVRSVADRVRSAARGRLNSGDGQNASSPSDSGGDSGSRGSGQTDRDIVQTANEASNGAVGGDSPATDDDIADTATRVSSGDLGGRGGSRPTRTGASDPADPTDTARGSPLSGDGGSRPASAAVVGKIIAQNTELFTTSADDPDGGPLTRDDITVTRQADGSVDVQVSADGRRAIAAARGQNPEDVELLRGAVRDAAEGGRRERELAATNRAERIDEQTVTPLEGAADDYVDSALREQELDSATSGEFNAAANGLFGPSGNADETVLGSQRPTITGTANSGPAPVDLGNGAVSLTPQQQRLALVEQQIEDETGQNVDVAIAEDGSLDVTRASEERFGDNAVDIPGTNLTVEGLVTQLSEGGRQRIGDAANAAVNLPGRAANPNRGTFEDLTERPQGAIPNAASGAIQGAASLPLLALDTAQTADEAVELGAFTARETVNLDALDGGDEPVVDLDRTTEIGGELGSEGRAAAGAAFESANQNRARTAGLAIGSLGGTAAAFRATAGAGRVGTATRFAIQPGEEIAGAAGFRATRATLGQRRADQLFPNQEPVFLSEEFALRAGRRGLDAARSRGRAAARRVRDTDVSITSNNRIGSGLGAFEVEVSRSETESGASDEATEGVMIDGEIVELPDSIASTDPDVGDASAQSFRPEFDQEADVDPTDAVQRRRARNRNPNDEALSDSVDTGRDTAFQQSLSDEPTVIGRDQRVIDESTQSDFLARAGPEAGVRGAGLAGRGRGVASDVLSDVAGDTLGRVDSRVDTPLGVGGRSGTDTFTDIFGETEIGVEEGLGSRIDTRTETRTGIESGVETYSRQGTESLTELFGEQEQRSETEVLLETETETRGRAEALSEEAEEEDADAFENLFGARFDVRDSGIASGEDALDELTGF